jgi:predicted nuclease of restriction endonuclease-like (RecB) superfamily
MTMSLAKLASILKDINAQTVEYTAKAINRALTVRSWAYGYYIQGYELNGSDRAQYGEELIKNLSKLLENYGISSISTTYLKTCLQFYKVYPLIGQTLSDQLQKIIPNLAGEIGQTVSDQSKKATEVQGVPVEKLLNSLAYSHFVELMKIDDSLKRAFYEIECIRGSWSVRELKRQINSLYYERSALSKNKEKLSNITHSESEAYQPSTIIRDPYVFEFLGVKSHEVILENSLGDALLDKLQNFLLELGKGFCFEARNKRILIGEKYYFVDLVFYHRILKCHVLIELKAKEFTHENIGQLNTYVRYFKRHEMQAGDNPPIGILLCTDKDETLIEYAMDESTNNIFVSKYKLELPTEAEIKKFIEQAL